MVLFFGLNHNEKYCTISTVILHRLYRLESCQIVYHLFSVKILQILPVIFLAFNQKPSIIYLMAIFG